MLVTLYIVIIDIAINTKKEGDSFRIGEGSGVELIEVLLLISFLFT